MKIFSLKCSLGVINKLLVTDSIDEDFLSKISLLDEQDYSIFSGHLDFLSCLIIWKSQVIQGKYMIDNDVMGWKEI